MPIDIIELLKSIRKGETMCAFCDVLDCPEKDSIMDLEMKSKKGLIVLTSHCKAYNDRRKTER
jgi:hypothetical protein